MHHHQRNPRRNRGHHIDFGRREARGSGLLVLEVSSSSNTHRAHKVRVASGKEIAKSDDRTGRIGRLVRKLQSAQPRSSRFCTRARKAAMSKHCSPIWIFVSTSLANTRDPREDHLAAHGLVLLRLLTGETAWISVNVSYGLFLSDHRILTMQETELVVTPAIMTQNLRGPTYWHLRACLRVGMEPEEVEAVHKVIEAVAAHGGKTLDVQRVADVTDA